MLLLGCSNGPGEDRAGGIGEPSPPPVATIRGGDNDNLGYHIASGEDVDGDGYDDVFIGAVNDYLLGHPDIYEPTGVVSLFFGPLSGTLDAGDAPVRLTSGERGDGLGFTHELVGDIDGDGHGDLMVGLPNDDGDTGVAYLLPGAAELPPSLSLLVSRDFRSVHGAVAGQGLGQSVAGIGDVDGDGLDDVAVGSDFFGTQGGEVAVLLGPLLPTQTSGDAQGRLHSEDSGDAAGVAVAAAGDVDGDGFAELLVAAPHARMSRGRVYLVQGPVTGEHRLPDVALASIEGPHPEALTGVTVEGLGDVDGDGAAEVAIGSGWADLGGERAGALHVLSGPLEGSVDLAEHAPALVGEQEQDVLGFRLVGGGDLDCDGRPDVAVSAPRYSRGAADVSKVYALDAATRAVRAPMSGAQPGDLFGMGLAAGDLDGDGCQELLVGAPRAVAGGDVPGRVYLFAL